jgi:hypothetical protein
MTSKLFTNHITKKRKKIVSTTTNSDKKINHGDFSLVWLDVNNEQSEIKCRLRHIINFLKLFDNVDKCIEYIFSTITEKIFLITSGALSDVIIPRIHEYSQKLNVFIYFVIKHLNIFH